MKATRGATMKATTEATVKDTWRLRGTLRIAITCLPLLAGCTKTKRGGETPTPTPTVTASPSPTATASPSPSLAAGADAGAVDPKIAAACRSNFWGKAPAAKVAAFATGPGKLEGCPTTLTADAKTALGRRRPRLRRIARLLAGRRVHQGAPGQPARPVRL